MSSAHVQSNKGCSYKKLKSRIHEEGHKRGSGPHDCKVCDRGFPSERSLYGHMRCHPEREWRGVDPPSVRVGWMNELENSWPVKAKRGRPDQSLKHGVVQSGDGSDEANIKKRKGGDWEIQVQELIKRRRWNAADDVGTSENGNGESESDLFVGACFLANCLHRRKCENGVKNVVFDQLLQSDNLHVCPVCDKSFRTRQSLGWHRKICRNKGGKERVLSVREFDLNMVPDPNENGTGGGGESHVL